MSTFANREAQGRLPRRTSSSQIHAGPVRPLGGVVARSRPANDNRSAHVSDGAVAKRALDLCLATILLLFVCPLLLIAALWIKLETRGPVFFRQRRTGRGGEVFRIYKFRTMGVCEDGADIPQASRCDPRITRSGRFLRRTSIDELPQLLNVLKGEMSLVGPRPHALAHDALFRALVPSYDRRFAARPGMTGLAQVRGQRGRTDTSAEIAERLESDLEYIRDWSLKLDLVLIARSALLVLKAQAH